MKLKRILMSMLLIFCISAVALGQNEAPLEIEDKEPKKTDAWYKVRLGAVIWLNWHTEMDHKNDTNMFEIERAYISLAKRFNDYCSANIVWDVAPQVEVNVATPTYASKKYNTYLKVANFTVMGLLGPVKLGLKVGLIDTPYFYISGRSVDYHINRDPLEFNGLDPLFDLGGVIIFKLYQYVQMDFAITEGEGYKNIGSKNDRGKAYSSRISVMPVKGLSIDGFGYINLPNGRDMEGTQYGYAGASVSYKTPLIQVGASFFNRQVISTIANDPVELQNNDWIIDFWTNVDLGPVTNFPFLLWFSFEYYVDSNNNGNSLLTNGSDILQGQVNSAEYYQFGMGFGYRFHKHIQANILFTHKNPEGLREVNTLYFKVALRF